MKKEIKCPYYNPDCPKCNTQKKQSEESTTNVVDIYNKSEWKEELEAMVEIAPSGARIINVYPEMIYSIIKSVEQKAIERTVRELHAKATSCYDGDGQHQDLGVGSVVGKIWDYAKDKGIDLN